MRAAGSSPGCLCQSATGFNQVFRSTKPAAAMASTSRPMNSGQRNGALPKDRPAPGDVSASAAGAARSMLAVVPPAAGSAMRSPVREPNSEPPVPLVPPPPGDPGGTVPEPPLLPGAGVELPGPQPTTQPGGPAQPSTQGVGPLQLSTQGVGPLQLSTQGVGPPQLSTQGVGPPQLSTQGVGPPQLSTHVGSGGTAVGSGGTDEGSGDGVGVGTHPRIGRQMSCGRAALDVGPTLVLADAIRPIPKPETAKRIIPASVPTSQRGHPGLPRRLM